MVPCAALEIRQHLLQKFGRTQAGKPEENRRKTGTLRCAQINQVS